jgi:hypothetical protein
MQRVMVVETVALLFFLKIAVVMEPGQVATLPARHLTLHPTESRAIPAHSRP